MYKSSWVYKYFNYDVKTDNGIVYFYNLTKRRDVDSSRFNVWLKIDDMAKLYFNPSTYWKEKYSDEWPEWILSTDLCTIPHGFQSNNAPGTKSFLFQPPFFIIYKTVGAEYNFLQFDDFNKPNIEKSILAMLTYDEETNRLKPQFAPHLILPYSNVLSLNNFLEFKMVDSKGDQILVSDNSQLFILLTLL